MTLYDLLAQGKPNASARVFLTGMQALKQGKDTLGVLRFDANPVILDGEAPSVVLFQG